MWPELPIEFYVIGTPVSVQSKSPTSKDQWKFLVLAAAQDAIAEGSWAFDEKRLAITLMYFPAEPMSGDIDNIVKLTIDALIPNVYVDDSIIDRVVVQRFSPEIAYSFQSPSPILTAAMARVDPTLYIRITETPLEDIVV